MFHRAKEKQETKILIIVFAWCVICQSSVCLLLVNYQCLLLQFALVVSSLSVYVLKNNNNPGLLMFLFVNFFALSGFFFFLSFFYRVLGGWGDSVSTLIMVGGQMGVQLQIYRPIMCTHFTTS